MAYIAPNTSVILYGNVPLDKGYNHTYYFADYQLQNTFFLAPAQSTGINIIRTLNKYYYVRDGVLKVQVRKEDLEGCNYMRFVNNMDITSPKVPKVFYAFVDALRWVNNETTEIYYTIDVLQSYMFDIQLMDSFVEREHSTSDNIGEFHIEESINCADNYILNKPILDANLTPDGKCVLIFLNKRTAAESSDVIGVNIPVVRRQENQIIGLPIIAHSTDNESLPYSAMVDWLEDYIDDHDGGNWIDVMYQIPTALFMGTAASNGFYEDINSTGYSPLLNLRTTSIMPNNNAFGNYVPKNNKMYNYPYMYVLLTNYAGDNIILKPEYFGDYNNPKFRIMGTQFPAPAVSCFPVEYRGFGLSTRHVDEGVTVTNFPQIPFIGSTFKDFINRNGLAMGISAAVTIGAAVAGGAVGVGAAQTMAGLATTDAAIARGEALVSNAQNRAVSNIRVATASSVGNAIGDINAAANAPNQTKNLSTQATGLRSAHNLYRIGVYLMTIPEDCAKVVDEYFTKYGYACKRTKVPNMHARSRFTYTKTVGCNLRGNAPSEVIDIIKNIFDNGVTFWADPAHFCDYSIANNIPSG